jgi:DNA-directed RNA polymerase specialized sigma24 family protein
MAPHQVIEDACAFAWLQLLRTEPEREAIFAWLKVVAVREAIRLQTHKPTEPLEAPSGEPAVEPEPRDIETECVAREALGGVAALPARQARILGLHVGGYSYAEIGERTGDTYRTVDRQMARARRALETA